MGDCHSYSDSELYSKEDVKRIVDAARDKLMQRDDVKARVEAAIDKSEQEQFEQHVAGGASPEDARRLAADFARRMSTKGENFDLSAEDSVTIHFDDGGTATLAELRAAYESGDRRFHGQSCADPFDAKQRGGKAMVFYNDTTLIINSFLGGGTLYRVLGGTSEQLPALSTDDQVNAEIYRLAELSQVDYHRERRSSARDLGMTVTALEQAVITARRQRQALGDAPAVMNAGAAGTLSAIVANLRRPEITGYDIAFDDFYGTEVYSPAGEGQWQEVTDELMVELRMELGDHGGEQIGRELMRDAMKYVAKTNRIDTGIEWTKSLPAWDGVPRVESFCARYLGTDDTPYHQAVGCYLWTALAGRVLEPGIKADMIPLWVGDQGQRKSTTVMALVPDISLFAELSFRDSEAELARKSMGKIAVELAECAGLNRKEVEEVKAWASRTHEQWVPKWCERAYTHARRFVAIATSNRADILQDATGNRRWLPMMVGQCDPDAVAADREQLWAEAIVLFRKNGVMWQEAEELAKEHLADYETENPVLYAIQRWLTRSPEQLSLFGDRRIPWSEEPFIPTALILSQAVGAKPADLPRYKQSIGKAMRDLGYNPCKRRYKEFPNPVAGWEWALPTAA